MAYSVTCRECGRDIREDPSLQCSGCADAIEEYEHWLLGQEYRGDE